MTRPPDLPSRIRALRRRLDEDVATFGARFARSGRTVEDWEQGRRKPDALAIRMIETIERQRAKALRRIRQMMASFGHPVDQMSDDEIEDGCLRLASVASRMGSTFARALSWASDADAGDYLITYEATGMSTEDDPGSRCCYGDDELAAIGAVLRQRGLRLAADDRGLVAVAIEG